MKNVFLTLLTACILVAATAITNEEATYDGPAVSYHVETLPGQVLINLELDNPTQYNEIKIVRSDNPVKYFRQIKLLSGSVVSNMEPSHTVIDKFPLPASQNSFYKVVTIDKSGVQKTYPTVKLVR